MFKRALLAGALGFALATAGAVTTHAVKANEVERYEDVDAGLEEFLSFVCGFDVEFSVAAYGTVRFFDNGRITANEHGTFSISANGRSLTQTWAGLFKGQDIETHNEDGTITVDFDGTNYGLHAKWVGEDGRIIVMDRGRVHHLGTVTFNPETGELIHLEDEHDANGPHPILDQGGLEPSDACDYFSS